MCLSFLDAIVWLFGGTFPPQSYCDLQMPVPGKNGKVRPLGGVNFNMQLILSWIVRWTPASESTPFIRPSGVKCRFPMPCFCPMRVNLRVLHAFSGCSATVLPSCCDAWQHAAESLFRSGVLCRRTSVLYWGNIYTEFSVVPNNVPRRLARRVAGASAARREGVRDTSLIRENRVFPTVASLGSEKCRFLHC